MMATKRQPAAEKYFEHKPPCDENAELGVLGSIMLLPSVFDTVREVLREEDFYDDTNRAIWRAMQALDSARRPIDATLLVERLRVAGDWKIIPNGPGVDSAYIGRMCNAVPNAAHTLHYADIVADKSRLRKVILHCNHALEEAYSELPSHDVVGGLESRIASIEHANLVSPVTMAEAASDIISQLTQPQDHSRHCMTGIATIDEMIGPIMPGEIAVIAGRTSLGKSSLTQQILMHSAQHQRPALLVSLEMKAKELATRELCRRAHLDSRAVRRGNIGCAVIESLENERDGMLGLPFHIWTPARATVSDIRAVAKKIQARNGLHLLAVDLIGLVAPEKEYAKQKREEQLRCISAGLKAVAAELNIPVIFVAQLNRDADSEEPRLSHLRDSGRLEEDADVVLLLHHNKKATPAADWRHQKRTLIVAKHRNGQIGALEIGWHPIRTMFTDSEEWPE